MTVDVIANPAELLTSVKADIWDYRPIAPGIELRVIWIADTIERQETVTWTTWSERLPPGVWRVKLRLWLDGARFATEKLYADVNAIARTVTWLGEWQDPDLQPRPLTRREQRQHAGFVRAGEPGGRRRPFRLTKKFDGRFWARHYAGTAAGRTWVLRQYPPRLHEVVDAELIRLVLEHAKGQP